jgi:hypothetical protein
MTVKTVKAAENVAELKATLRRWQEIEDFKRKLYPYA